MKRCLAAVLILSMPLWPASLTAQPKISVEARLEAVLHEIAGWFRDGWATWQESEREKVRKSVPKLVADFLRIAAVMDSFAGGLEEYTKGETSSAAAKAALLDNLQRQLRTMQDLMRDILETTGEDLDVQWTTENVRLADRSFKVVQARGLLAGEAAAMMLVLESEGEARELDPGQVRDLAQRLRGIAATTRGLAEEISVTTME